MKKILTILLFASCNTKQPEPKPLVMGITTTTYVTVTMLNTAIRNVQLQNDSLKAQIKSLINNQQGIWDGLGVFYKRTDDLQKADWRQDSLYNISDTAAYDPLFYKVNQLRPHYTFITKP